MALIICILRDEESLAKGIIGFTRDRKVPRKDLATVSSPGHLGGGLKEVPVQGETLCQPRIIGDCYFQIILFYMDSTCHAISCGM